MFRFFAIEIRYLNRLQLYGDERRLLRHIDERPRRFANRYMKHLSRNRRRRRRRRVLVR